MKTIDVNTTQNVVIVYPLATVFQRYLAGLIDISIISFSVFILQAAIGDSSNAMLTVILIPFILYSLLLETFWNGVTIGKRVLAIKVIRTDGKELQFVDCLLRWTFRFVDVVMSLTGLGLFSMITSKNNQRLGDYLANTIVVNNAKNNRIKHESLLNFQNFKDYEVKYPEVLNLKESDMLLIKEVVMRYEKMRNTAHTLAVEATVNQVSHQLGISTKEKSLDFLKTLIKDYIILTR